MATTPSTSAIPERLSEQEARKIIEAEAPRHQRLTQDAGKIAARQEEAQRRLAELEEQARQKLGTSDEKEIRRIFEERQAANAQRVQAYVKALAETEAAIKQIAQATARP